MDSVTCPRMNKMTVTNKYLQPFNHMSEFLSSPVVVEKNYVEFFADFQVCLISMLHKS